MKNFNGNMCWMCMWCDPTASALSCLSRKTPSFREWMQSAS